MSIVIFGMNDMEETILSYLNTHSYEDRLTIVLYLVNSTSEEALRFPINKLRNIGIRSSHTTHYLVIDMDVWPAGRFVLVFVNTWLFCRVALFFVHVSAGKDIE